MRNTFQAKHINDSVYRGFGNTNVMSMTSL